MNPYESGEVIETFSRINGRQWWVRDEEIAAFWLVEYVARRLTCWCDDGQAHAETPDVELPCAHLRAAVDHRTAANKAAGPPLGTLVPAVFCD